MIRGFITIALFRTTTALSLGRSRSPSVFGSAIVRPSDSPRQFRTSTPFRHLTRVLHSMDPKGKRKATGPSPASSSAAVETPEWFKPERVRCLTEATTPNPGEERAV